MNQRYIVECFSLIQATRLELINCCFLSNDRIILYEKNFFVIVSERPAKKSKV